VTPSDWERLKPLFDRAQSMAPDERAAFVEEIAQQDPELGRQLSDLLRQPTESEAAETESLLLMPALIAGRFRLLRAVGRGGMGEVFEAQDLQLNDRVALKIIRPDIAANPAVAERFKREILLGKRIANANVCRIHDLGTDRAAHGSEMFFLTMEFLHGETLSARLRRGPMSMAEALPLLENLADGLTAAHEAGIVHRDFKSGNVMLVQGAQRTRAVITDFGLARAVHDSAEREPLTKPGAVTGTVGYMAPEQIRGERAGPAADIYALGVVAYQMVTGKLPFDGATDMSVALQHLNSDPPPPRKITPSLDANWEAAILGCLRKDPQERFASAADFKQALLSPSKSTLKLQAKRRPGKLVYWLIGAVTIVAIAVSGYLARHPDLITKQRRVAVLEFENIGGIAENRAFCEGLMETLSSQLTELEQFQGALSVVPASEVRKEKVTSAREAQRDFGVTLAITGSVQRTPDGIRLTFNLVDARELKQLRSHTVFLAAADSVSMQQGVIQQVTDLLDIQMRPEAKQRLSAGNTTAPGAYDFYLQGAGYLAAGSGYTDQAIAEFQHALERDPNYPLAHAGLGRAYWTKYTATRDAAWIDKAWAECRQAIKLGPQLPEAHITLAILNFGTGHYDDAAREAQRAIQIDPYSDAAYSELARALDATGQMDAAEATNKKAVALRPGSWINYVRLGIFYYRHERYKEAEAPFSRVIELVPDNQVGYTNLGSAYHAEGREAEAEKLLKKSIETRPTPMAYTNLATVYFFERKYAEAVPIMEKVVEGSKEYLYWGNLADAYRWSPGNADKARGAYGKAIALAAQALAVNPRDSSAWSSSGLYHAKLGQKAGASADMNKALALAPDDKSILFNAALTSELAGERAKALQFLRKAVLGGYSPNEIATEPELGQLRQDPSYQAIVSLNKGR